MAPPPSTWRLCSVYPLSHISHSPRELPAVGVWNVPRFQRYSRLVPVVPSPIVLRAHEAGIPPLTNFTPPTAVSPRGANSGSQDTGAALARLDRSVVGLYRALESAAKQLGPDQRAAAALALPLLAAHEVRRALRDLDIATPDRLAGERTPTLGSRRGGDLPFPVRRTATFRVNRDAQPGSLCDRPGTFEASVLARFGI